MFPAHDKYWTDTVDFIKKHLGEGERLIAPVEFQEIFSGITYPYYYTPLGSFQWAIIHKGMMNKIDYDLLRQISKEFIPVFANEVFVVFSSNKKLPKVNPASPHIKSFRIKMGHRHYKALLKPIASISPLNQVRKLFRKTNLMLNQLEEIKEKRGMVYLGNNKALTRTIFGQKMYVDTRDLSLAPHILLDGYWEMWITKFFKRIICEGMIVVEVGANIGYYTLLIASQIGSRGRLYAFEANPEVFDILFCNINVNGFMDRTILVNKAAVDKSQKLKFHKCKRFHGSSSIIELNEEFLKRYRDEIETIEVDTVSLDEYFIDKDMKVDIIKMDAEGAEALIFKGMRNLLEKNLTVKIICEFAPRMIIATGIQPRQFLEEITDYGFKLRFINTDSNAVDITIDELMEIPHCDLYLSR
ncbi:MAG: FkbM family methyltransferase [Rhodocyclaceae bacterium]|nr:FkbM family methyltransferase [Rhodocyclaceae bacterium]